MATPLGMAALINNFMAWANGVHVVRTAAVVGSRARADRPADQWSDLVVIVTNPQPFLITTDWLQQNNIAPKPTE